MTNKVLIVDDDDAVLNMLYKVIKSNGIEADTCSSGESALDLVSKQIYDLILLDINMQGMDGFQVVETLRKQGIKTPIIILSGRAEDYDMLYGLDIGADDYITKPFNPIIVGAKVKALIRRSQNGVDGSSDVITAGPFQYNTSTLRFYKNGEEILLSAKENAIMNLRLENPEAPLQQISDMLLENYAIKLSKSGVNHIFTSLHEKAEKLRKSND